MKHIKLTQSKVTVVDDQDFDWLDEHKWHVKNNQYAVRAVVIQTANKHKNTRHKNKRIFMHREILEHKLGRRLHKKEQVDHVNGNGLDNRRENLRSCNSSQNIANSKKQKRQTSSTYKGLSWHKKDKKWHARIQVRGKRIHLGCFDDEIQAAKTYNKAALEYFGEFARVNPI